MESILSFTTSFQKATSLEDITSRNVFGSSSIFRSIGVTLITEFLSLFTKNTTESVEIKYVSMCFSFLTL